MSVKSCMEHWAMCYSPEGSSSIQYSRGIAHFVYHLDSYFFLGVLEATAGWAGVWMGHSWVLGARRASSPRIRSSLHSCSDEWDHTGEKYFDNWWWLLWADTMKMVNRDWSFMNQQCLKLISWPGNSDLIKHRCRERELISNQKHLNYLNYLK